MNRIDDTFFNDTDTLLAFIEALPLNIFFKDTASVYRLTSDTNEEVRSEKYENKILNLTDAEVFEHLPELAHYYIDDDRKIAAAGEPSVLFNEIPSHTGTPKYIRVLKNPVYSSNGAYAGIAGVVLDQTEDVRVTEALQKKVVTDTLTGAGNRRGFESFSEYPVSEDALPLSIILCDISYLKRINDNLGHRNGDVMLISAAKGMRMSLPKQVNIYRIGGDEFCVVLPNTSLQMAMESIKVIKRNERLFSVCGIPVHNAFGAAEINTPSGFEQAFVKAEKAMYRDKKETKEKYRGSFEKAFASYMKSLAARRVLAGEAARPLREYE